MRTKSAEPGIVTVVGAGISGLVCARALHRAGRRVQILERSHGVGGRLATWRHNGAVIDYGALFVHGSHPDLLRELDGVEGARVDGWPQRVEGRGAPCQPRAFAPRERRLAWAEGVTCWPKQIAHELSIVRETPVVGLRFEVDHFVIRTSTREIEAPTVVLAMPSEELLALTADLPTELVALSSARHLLQMLPSMASLTVAATYPRGVRLPDWQMLYPHDSEILQLVSVESSKRRQEGCPSLMIQARSAWSHARRDDPEDTWAQALLQEAARFMGAWVADPQWTRPHRWRYARTELGEELSHPLLIEFPRGARLGITGELLARGAGVEAAWLAGRELGERLLGKEIS